MNWEYKSLAVKAYPSVPADLDSQITALGAQGWELTHVEPILSGGVFFLFLGGASYTKRLVLFFKRPVER